MRASKLGVCPAAQYHVAVIRADADGDEPTRAKAWLDEKWTGRKDCPICQQDRWTVTGVTGMLSLNSAELPESGEVFPVFNVVCTVCGFVRSFSAVIAGLSDPLVDRDSGEVRQK